MKRSFLLTFSLLFPGSVFGWGDAHGKITQAAQAIVPDGAKWESLLGAGNWRDIGRIEEMTGYAGLPDNQSQYVRRPWGEYFADDYLLTREVPFLYGYHVPSESRRELNQELVGFAKRALQAMRTESPKEAARRIGVLLHFCEDAGATAHAARISPPAHTLLDNTVPLERITLPDYQPALLGRTDEEFTAALVKRVGGLIDYSLPIGKKLLAEATELAPVYQTARIGRTKERLDAIGDAQVPPALECVRVAADTIFTLCTLGLTEPPRGASLSGIVSWAATPAFEKSGAEVLLLDAEKYNDSPSAVFASCTPYTTHTDEQGGFTFHDLPDGTYRVLAYRVGSKLMVSEPLTLVEGKAEHTDLRLPATERAGNLVYNPELALSSYVQGMPDRWMALAPLKDGTHTYMNALVPVPAGKKLDLGAALRDPAARVSFIILPRTDMGRVQDCSRTMKLDASFRKTAEFTGQGGEGEALTPDGSPSIVLIYVETSKSLAEAVAHLWVQVQ